VKDGEFDDGEEADVGRVDDVGDVAVGEDITRFQAEEGGFGGAGVGAAEPEDLGGLAFGAGGEEVGVLLGGGGGPALVGLKGEGVGGVYITALVST